MDVGKLRRDLLAWYGGNKRDLPWRRTDDPYRIWVSEIMLQQTRVAAVIPYYERFLERFPDLESLAKASEEDLLTAWAGLGYYSRVRNMQKAARQAGEFPGTYDGIRAMAGVGDYTAAAVASIAFGLPHAAVDGNVLRVLARLTADDGDIASVPVRRRLADVAQGLLDPERPGDWNQALMELGATVCLPGASAQCLVCPLREHCRASATGRQNELPVKLSSTETIRAERTLLVIRRGDKVLLRRHKGFWELPEPEHFVSSRVLVELGAFNHSIMQYEYRFRVVEARARGSVTGLEWRDLAATRPLSTVVRKAAKLFANS